MKKIIAIAALVIFSSCQKETPVQNVIKKQGEVKLLIVNGNNDSSVVSPIHPVKWSR